MGGCGCLPIKNKLMQNRFIIIIGLILCVYSVQAQVFISNKTTVSFFSETPLENIEATNSKSSSLLNIKDMQVVFQIPVKAFEFEKDMMKVHFNENYLETEKYPKASFNGNINEDVDLSKDGTFKVTVTGKLLIHGVERERTMVGTIIRKGKDVSLEGQFQVILSEHNVKIPKVVIANIAEVIEVKVSATYKPYVKKKK